MNEWRDFTLEDFKSFLENGIIRVENVRFIKSEICTPAKDYRSVSRGKGKKRKLWEGQRYG
jgi:hypothetical protein